MPFWPKVAAASNSMVVTESSVYLSIIEGEDALFVGRAHYFLHFPEPKRVYTEL